ncbi:MAG TPA: hypothetical protein VF442_00060 [Sphingobium sp.]
MIDQSLILHAKAMVSQMDVILLYGGASSERGSSLTTRDAIEPILKRLCRTVLPIDFLDRNKLAASIADADFVVNVVYGRGGEDGTVQGFFETLGIDHFGPGVLASAVGMNKEIFISLLRAWDYPVPAGIIVKDLSDGGTPWPEWMTRATALVLKPVDEGDSLGIRMFPDVPSAEHAVASIEKEDRWRWRIEEFVSGRFATVGLLRLGNEIIAGDVIVFDLPDGYAFYDERLKLKQVEDRATPRVLETDLAKKVVSETTALYERLRCKGLVRFDLIYADDGYKYLEANTIPGMYPGSNAALGFERHMNFEDLLALTIFSQTTRPGKPSLRNRTVA